MKYRLGEQMEYISSFTVFFLIKKEEIHEEVNKVREKYSKYKKV